MKSIKLTLIICLLYISNIGVFGQTINSTLTHLSF